MNRRKFWIGSLAFLLCVACIAGAMGLGLGNSSKNSLSAFAAEESAQNLALSATVTTDSDWPDPEGYWSSQFINDGHKLYGWPVPVTGGTLGWRSSYTGSREVDMSLTLDLGQKATVDRVVLYPRGGNAVCFPDDYAIEVSLDGTTWTEVASRTGDTEIKAEGRELSFTATQTRYVRLKVTKLAEDMDSGYWVCELSEMEVWGIPSPEQNLAIGATVTTDSDWPDPEGYWSSQFINDGHKLYGWPVPVTGGTLGWRSSYTGSREVDMSLTLDLGQKATVDRVVLYPRGGNAVCFPDDYAIEVSLDGTTWTEVASRTGDTEIKAEGRELSFTATQTRYVRLKVTKLAEDMDSGYWVCELSEMEVWGIPVAERNLALNASVTTNSDWPDPEGYWSSQFINDGHKLHGWPVPVAGGTLGWRSAASETREVNMTMTLNLGKRASISRVVLYPRGGNAVCFPDDYAIEVSLDGLVWTEVASRTGDTEVVAQARELSFDQIDAQYVRLKVTKLAEDMDSGYWACEISEMEVWGDMQDYLDLNKNEIWMEVGTKDKLYGILSGEKKEGLVYESEDPSIATVDDQGNVVAIASGETTITCSDPESKLSGSCAVKVKIAEKENIQIIVPMWGNESLYTEEQFRWLQEANVDVVMMVGAPNCGFQDFGDRALAIARKIYDKNASNNLEVMLFGHQHGISLLSSEAELIAFAEQYRNTPLLAGYHLQDEPIDVNPFARMVRVLRKTDPHSLTDVNFLPGFIYGNAGEHYGISSDYYGRLTDYAILCGSGNTYLSFDNYPFTPAANSVDEYNLFGNFETLRQAGLTTGAPTAFYLQGVGSSHFGYRRPDANVLRYHTASALSYGFKALKYYSWYVPGTMLTDEHTLYTDAIMDAEGNKTDLYEVAAELNRQVHNVGDILVQLEAVEVYHTEDGPNGVYSKIPTDFFVQVQGSEQAIVSLMVQEETGESYLMVVNKDFTAEKTISLSLKGVHSLVEIDKLVEDGTLTPNFANGVLTRTFAPGEFALYRLPAGNYTSDGDKASKNLLADATVSANDSFGKNGYYMVAVHDGERAAEGINKGWMFEAETPTDGWLVFDLGDEKSFNRLDLYPAGEGVTCGNFFPSKIQILVSHDGTTWNEVYRNSSIGTVTSQVPVFRFDQVSARYLKLVFPDTIAVAVAEAELYLDDGTVAEPPATSYEKPVIQKDDNVAVGKTVTVSSAYIDGAWNPSFATDTVKMTTWPTDQTLGWCSAYYTSGDQTEWIRVDLGTVYPIDRVVLYPRGNGGTAFPVDYKVQVSIDGITWTDVATVTNGEINVEKSRTFTFDTVLAKYVRVYATKLSEDTPGIYCCCISEVEVYCDALATLNEQIGTLPTTITEENVEATAQAVDALKAEVASLPQELQSWADQARLAAVEAALAAYTPNQATGDTWFETLCATVLLALTSVVTLVLRRRRPFAG